MMKKLACFVLATFVLLGLMPGVALTQDDPQAVTVIDDFDTAYESGDLTSQWWSYTDDLPETEFVFELDTETVYNGTGSVRLDLNIAAGGYAGIGFDYGTPRDWQKGQGVVMQVRASAAGLPMVMVLHVKDDTQTSEFSPGVTPFGAAFTTPPGSETDWMPLVLAWDDFERLTWIGTEGLMEFTPNPILGLEVAFEATPEAPINGTIWIDDIRVISDEDLNIAPDSTEIFSDLPAIRTSQIGYRPDDRKLFVANVPVTTFSIVDDATGVVAYTAEATAWGFDEDAQHEVYQGQFDALTTAGTYRIVIEGVGESYPFVIGDAYDEALILGARALYLQRSGIAIHDAEISGIDIEAGHLTPAILWGDTTETPLNIFGGWYDAGDFGRYIPTGAFAVNQLLYGFSANPEFFADGSLSIPESGNGLPDLLDEIRWELDWMLRMQREDGAVHHKITTRSFPGFGALPAEDTDQLYVFDVSSADAAYFAAVMAQAAGVYAPYDAEYAAICLEAAVRAWTWLEGHPEQFPAGGFQNPPVSEYPMQGGYDFVGQENVPRMWAAAELFNATGEAKYETAFAEHFRASAPNHTMSWANSYPMGLYAYLTSASTDTALYEEVAGVFQQQAQAIYDVSARTGYNVALSHSTLGFEYIWGSNQVTLAHGLYLMLANELFPNEEYSHAALAQIHYLFGVNPLAKAYFSGAGTDQILHPHHNLSYHLQRPVPGLVGEGANRQNAGGDAVLEAIWEAGAPPAMAYVDDWNSWASNEPTIDANATFVALLSYFAK